MTVSRLRSIKDTDGKNKGDKAIATNIIAKIINKSFIVFRLGSTYIGCYRY